MAEEVEMIPVDPVEEPPKASPLAKPAGVNATPPKLNPLARKPGTTTAALKPGLRLPPKPGATVSALRPGLKLPPKPGAVAPGLKLPTQTALKPGVKLPPKPGATVSTLRPGLKLPTQTALKPGVKLPPKPVIRKPGATGATMPLPKPMTPTGAVKPLAPAAAKPAETPAPKPIAVDAQGVGKLPTVDSKTIARDDTTPVQPPKPMEALKSVTQKLKGITQEIPQQAILRKTGIIAEGAMSEGQKEAAKHKTARISLSDAMGVAPVKGDAAPMKTIRIKRPIDIPNPTTSLNPQPKPAAVPAPSASAPAPAAASADGNKNAEDAPTAATISTPTLTQRKTLKIARPGGGAVRPAGKFGVKRPISKATTVAKPAPAAQAGDAAAPAAAPAGDAVADIPDIPSMPMAPVPNLKPQEAGPAWLWTLSALLQLAACGVMGALMWALYENTQTAYF